MATGFPIISPLTQAAAGRWHSAPAWALRRPSRFSVKPLDFELSLEKVGCFSSDTSAGTAAGLYNFYGEGQPAYVELSDNGLNIYSLSSVAGVQPVSAGLLTRIDNGYGASTTISYRSAKEDVNTNHLVPSPEVVVSVG